LAVPDVNVSRFDRFAFSWSDLPSIHIISSVDVIFGRCFCKRRSLASVTVDADVKVSRFDRFAFYKSGLTLIHTSLSVEVICESCFVGCKSPLIAAAEHSILFSMADVVV
jgi:hypothetical protein